MILRNPIYNKWNIVKDDKRDFTIIEHFVSERVSKNKLIRENAYRCKCNICGYVMVKKESEIIRGRGCPCCSGHVVVIGINDIPTTAPWMIKYFQGGYDEARMYTCNSNKKIYPICPNCGKIKEKTLKINNIYNNKSIGCSCNYKGTSYPERFMISILNQAKIEYEHQFAPSWLYGKRFDFCIDSIKLIIEMDGMLGHGYYEWGSNVYNEKSKDVDEWKDRQAYAHGYSVVRIDCKKSDYKYIKEKVLNSDLKKYLDFKSIDFSLCEKESLSNICKDICTYWEEHKDLSCKDIGEIFNCATYTVTKYLKKGKEVGWCSYTAEEALEKSHRKLAQYYKENPRKSKFDDIYVVGINKLGDKIMGNITEMSKIANVRKDRIIDVCEGKKYYNSAGGYVWRYIL